ncbi:MAG: DUF4105 domain-containing protein [Xanthomonadales bacterium]|jgi:hypothetical protein|nr:DUF4105 domain-containing protein [Xanthomonadales bacterium]
MSWIRRYRPGRGDRSLAVILVLLLFSLEAPAFEPEPPVGTEVWLVTYGPGEVYWQRFGHNAIWVRDSRLGLDHTFNYGFFDFEQENFFLRFLMGRMLYFSAAQEAAVEFAQYTAENRYIRAQRLELEAPQQEMLIRRLLEDIQPENRDYLYDYYRNNCSTRVRDALDRAVDGVLKKSSDSAMAPQTWRDHTRRLTAGDFWLYLGLESVLGVYVDRPISLWDEMFIPGVLAEVVGNSQGWVSEDRMLFDPTREAAPGEALTVWPRYLLASLVVLALAWLSGRWLPLTALARTWFTLSGLAGLLVLFFWFGTDHLVAGLNMNVLVFNPAWLVFAFWKRSWRLALPVVAVVSSASLAIALLPGQYTADVVAAFLPISLAAAWVLHRSAKR